MSNTQQQFRTAIKRLVLYVKSKIIIWVGTRRMRLGIKVVNMLHRKAAVKYLDKNFKELITYIVLLELPLNKKGKFYKTQRLFWVNRKNFRRIKQKGWIPKAMCLDTLRKNAFYCTDVNRDYHKEWTAREKAQRKYTSYLKVKHDLL